VDQATLTGEIGAPDLLLEPKRLPLVPGEPLANAIDRLAPLALYYSRRASPRLPERSPLLRALLAASGSPRPSQVHREGGTAPATSRVSHRGRWRGGSA
jgi:hypothetical protein